MRILSLLHFAFWFTYATVSCVLQRVKLLVVRFAPGASSGGAFSQFLLCQKGAHFVDSDTEAGHNVAMAFLPGSKRMVVFRWAFLVSPIHCAAADLFDGTLKLRHPSTPFF